MSSPPSASGGVAARVPTPRFFVLLLALCVAPTGCSAALRSARAHLAEGDHREAALAAGDDQLALQEVALALLARALQVSEHRATAAAGLRAGGDLAWPLLGELANAHDDESALLAASILALQGDDEQREVIRGEVGHDNPDVRAAVVAVLGRETSASELLRRSFNDTSPSVRRSAVNAISSSHRCADWALSLLADAARHDPEPSVRGAALRVLSYCDDGQTLLDLAREALAREAPAALRVTAISALERARDRDAVRLLLAERFTNGGQAEKLRAATVFARFGDDRGLEFLRRALTDESVSLATGAALAASSVGEPLHEALVEALERSEPAVRLYAATSLTSTAEHSSAVETLAELAARHDRIGASAALELARVGERREEMRERLDALLDHESENIRLLIARRSSALDHGVELAARALRDESEAVRIAGAASLLRARRHALDRTGMHQ